MLDHDITNQINHLMHKYAWCKQEAMEYLYYFEYDPIDWIDTQWENQPIRTN
jgi:hypothetical protein